MENRKVVEIERVINGTSIRVRKSVENGEKVEAVINDLLGDLGQTKMQEQITSQASVAQAQSMISPMPSMSAELAEYPQLENAPRSYKVGDAVVEVLNPEKSKWAAVPRAVKEIRERLTSIGVIGITDSKRFDKIMRDLNTQGRVKREKIDKVYKYYTVQ